MPERVQPTPPAQAAQPAVLRCVVLLLFGGAVLACALGQFAPITGNSGWVDAVLLIFAAAATVAGFSGRLPALNVIFAGGMAALIGGIAHAVNDVAGLPFGRFESRPEFGPKLLDVLPVAMPVLWSVASLNARGAARRLLDGSRSHPRHGFHVIALATGLMLAFHFAFVPFAVLVKGWWTPPASALLNFAAWIVMSLFIQIAMTPLLLDKFPVPRAPNLAPLFVWAGINLVMLPGLFAIQRWTEAVTSAAMVLVTIIVGARALRRRHA